jgi:hypothetical protein
MPSKEWYLALELGEGEISLAKKVIDTAVASYGAKKIKSLIEVDGGFRKAVILDTSDVEYDGLGNNKAEALADACSKLP